MKHSAELQAALDAAAQAANIARSMYQHNIEVRIKADKSPVTEADVRCETAIREIIEARFPSHGFYGEETGRIDMDAESLWLVDPIDGTKAFVREYAMFSTQIALMRNGELVLGVSSAPVYGEVSFCGARPRRLPERQTHQCQPGIDHRGSGTFFGQSEKSCRQPIVAALWRADCAARPYPRLRRFSALPSARRRKNRCRDRIRREYSRYRRMRADRHRGRRPFHRFERRALTLDSTSVLASNGHMHGPLLAAYG